MTRFDDRTSVCARNYLPADVTLTRGRGVWLWDDSDRKYLDFMSAYSAVSHGHAHPRLVAALNDQSQRLSMTSRAFKNDRLEPFLRKLCEVSGFDRALPMNTGAEAVETAIKAARRWGYRKMGIPADRAVILVASGNFHGRTTTITGFSTEPDYRRDFGPFTPGFRDIPYGDVDALDAAFDSDVCAVLIEPIQGEAGIVVPPEGYLKALRAHCDRTGALLLLDEIQSGLGRTGCWFAFQHEGVMPDGIVVGKALGGGLLPVSAFLARADVMEMFTPGSHGSTFGGNPLAARVGLEALEVIADEQLVERSAVLGRHLMQRLRAIASPAIRDVRGIGLWAGLELDPELAPAGAVAAALANRGVLTRETHRSTIRIAPPLVISRDELDWGIDRLEEVLAALAPTHAKPITQRHAAAPAVSPTIVMCAPEHFEVTYKINPWMAPGTWSANANGLQTGARSGWDALRQGYESGGARVLLMPPRHQLPDMVFTANAAVVLDRTVLLPRFRHPERQGEEAHVREYFGELLARGEIDRLETMPDNVPFEGAGDAAWDAARGMFWLGHGPRSAEAARETLSRVFGRSVVSLELVDPRFYHLDTCLAALSGGEILYFPTAFSDEGRTLIADLAGSQNLIAVSEADAAHFAVNCFELPGKHIYMGPCSDALEGALRARGYTVHHYALEPFMLSGGSACCLTLNLSRAA